MPGICGALADPRRRFVALNGMVAKAKAEALRKVLERAMAPHLSELSRPIPPETRRPADPAAVWALQAGRSVDRSRS